MRMTGDGVDIVTFQVLGTVSDKRVSQLIRKVKRPGGFVEMRWGISTWKRRCELLEIALS